MTGQYVIDLEEGLYFSESSTMKNKGNGLGENNAKSWNPKSMRDDRWAGAGQKNVPSEHRKGAGQKGSGKSK